MINNNNMPIADGQAPHFAKPSVSGCRTIPILFSTQMVDAILQGRKTMTRRILKVKGDRPFVPPTSWDIEAIKHWNKDYHPYGKVGDILWCRETFAETCDEYGSPIIAYKTGKPRLIVGNNGKYELWKETDTEWSIDNYPSCGKWKPSLFMPKYACRLFLEITDIKIERLQEISDADVLKEGVHNYPNPFKGWQELWTKINGEYSWYSNPFVYAISFKVVQRPNGFH